MSSTYNSLFIQLIKNSLLKTKKYNQKNFRYSNPLLSKHYFVSVHVSERLSKTNNNT